MRGRDLPLKGGGKDEKVPPKPRDLNRLIPGYTNPGVVSRFFGVLVTQSPATVPLISMSAASG
jgi:hypothetical protein